MCGVPSCRRQDVKRMEAKLEYAPRPEPDAADVAAHRQWQDEYETWRDPKCGCGKGYWCKAHAIWVTGDEVDGDLATPKDAQHQRCPTYHQAQSYGASQTSPQPSATATQEYEGGDGYNPTHAATSSPGTSQYVAAPVESSEFEGSSSTKDSRKGKSKANKQNPADNPYNTSYGSYEEESQSTICYSTATTNSSSYQFPTNTGGVHDEGEPSSSIDPYSVEGYAEEPAGSDAAAETTAGQGDQDSQPGGGYQTESQRRPHRGQGGETVSGNSAGWKKYRDASGRRYYYNASTGVTTWDKPQEMTSPQPSSDSTYPWERHTTGEGHAYWYNVETQKSQWHKPRKMGSSKDF